MSPFELFGVALFSVALPRLSCPEEPLLRWNWVKVKIVRETTGIGIWNLELTITYSGVARNLFRLVC